MLLPTRVATTTTKANVQNNAVQWDTSHIFLPLKLLPAGTYFQASVFRRAGFIIWSFGKDEMQSSNSTAYPCSSLIISVLLYCLTDYIAGLACFYPMLVHSQSAQLTITWVRCQLEQCKVMRAMLNTTTNFQDANYFKQLSNQHIVKTLTSAYLVIDKLCIRYGNVQFTFCDFWHSTKYEHFWLPQDNHTHEYL